MLIMVKKRLRNDLIAAYVSQTGQQVVRSIGCCLINSDLTLVEKFYMEEAAQKRAISTLRSFQNSASYRPSVVLIVSHTWGMRWDKVYSKGHSQTTGLELCFTEVTTHRP